jgi:hypothetical protein
MGQERQDTQRLLATEKLEREFDKGDQPLSEYQFKNQIVEEKNSNSQLGSPTSKRADQADVDAQDHQSCPTIAGAISKGELHQQKGVADTIKG